MNTPQTTTDTLHPTDSRDSSPGTLPPATDDALALRVRMKSCRFEIRSTRRPSFTEFHLTGLMEEPLATEAAARALLEQAAHLLTEYGIQPLAEKLYGRSTARATVLRLRDEIYRHHELDVRMVPTWIEGRPLGAGDLVGWQLWGIVPHARGVEVNTVETPGGGAARMWHGPGFRMLHLPFVRGTLPDGSLAGDAPAQAEAMFGNAEAALAAHGIGFAQVVRTWIYMDRLLEWYDDFNRVRTRYYRPAGFGGPNGLPYPASTGIQCHCADEECMMDVLAVETLDANAAPIATAIQRSPRQDQSFNYGSAFSRGMRIEVEGRRTVHISGTASINPAGASVHLDDPELQSLETLMCIAAILENEGGSLRNITSATLFCKTTAAWEAWQRVCRLLQVPDIPFVPVMADVCRHDLLVEMEAVAVI